MSSSVVPLALGRVIGDVIDMFVSLVGMYVSYGSRRVSNGCNITPSAAVNPPNIQITGDPDDFYTLVRMVSDIPGGSTASQGKEVLQYMAPEPPVGIHRFVFVLFSQNKTSDIPVMPPPARQNFRTRDFAAQYGFGLPVAGVYFNARKEPTKKKRR
ncbi:Phosphatidylethanolamine-binding protein PEBP [Cinnamomum micranthum f. kanehirae]|uniref:Phosphatidylethanolamine-binding protein PEBP n=1 Tax=Cinnamomum micranthum f. kanehirae TaxID=337451 RepID=A0A443NBB2_9MAGN|nr:Phosphatidylethanolamine-binding protein PEBP [Cinnamomum micranthum f. kanehirae]